MLSAQELKIIILFSLFASTFILSMLPVRIITVAKKQVDRYKRRRLRVMLSLLSCFSAGVFLGTCLLDLFPEVQEQMFDSFNYYGISSGYPVSEFIVVFGLCLMLIIEQTVLSFKDTGTTNYEPLASTDSLSSMTRSNSNVYIPPQNSASLYSETESEPENVEAGKIDNDDGGDELTESQMYQDPNSHSIIRSIILLVALSVHSIFEGLAIGLQKETNQVLGIFIPVVLHKSILAFSLGMNFVQTDMKLSAVVKSNLGFAITSPLGIGLGLAIVDLSSNAPITTLINGILQGIACGTFLYVVFFEILPHEFMSVRRYPSRLWKTLLLIAGFGSVGTILLFDPDTAETVCITAAN